MVRKVRMALPLLALLIATAGLAPHVAQASGNVTANQIWSNLTGTYVIGVTDGSTSDGAQLITWASNGNADQFWRFDYTDYGDQSIVDVKSGKCMGVAGGSISEGAAIVQWGCNGHPDQVWHLGGTDGSYAYDTLVNDNGMCVGIQGNSTSEGAKLVQWGCDGTGDKQWIPDSAPWGSHGWIAFLPTGNTDPINVIFNDPNRNALDDITSDLEAEGWAPTYCYNPYVEFNTGPGNYSPAIVLATNVGGNGTCGPAGTQRDHVRIWYSPDQHTAYMAASIEQTDSCGCDHFVVSFNAGRNTLYNDEVNRLTGRTTYIGNYAMQYAAGNLQNVNYDGWQAILDIGA